MPTRKSNRLSGYDYTTPGWYFLTICTHGGQCLFGDIAGDAMHMNALGSIAQECWAAIPAHHAAVRLDEWVVMPNHMHGIVCLASVPGVCMREAFGRPCRKSVATVVRAFKSASTRRMRELTGQQTRTFWQRGYWDHVIRTESSLDMIRQYIRQNPARWHEDDLFRSP